MPLNSCYLFEGLPQSQIERIIAITREQKFRKDQWLFQEGQEAGHLYLVKDGAVELVIKVEDAIEIPMAIIRPNNGCLGVGALVEPYRYSLSARCLDDSTLSVIARAQLYELMHDDSELHCAIMTNLAKKLLNRLTETRQEVKIHFMNLVRSITF
jgi:CRP/FNR family cyclic AMP-dependent transcriptional regulator